MTLFHPVPQEAPPVQAGRNVLYPRRVKPRCHGCEAVVRGSRNDSHSTHFVQLMARRRPAGIWVEWEKQRESQKSITSKPHPREERNIDAEKRLVIASYLKLIGQYRKSLINHPNPPASNLTKF